MMFRERPSDSFSPYSLPKLPPVPKSLSTEKRSVTHRERMATDPCTSSRSSIMHVNLVDADLAVFRTKVCEQHRKGNCHDSDRCPHSHCQTWQRRNPTQYTYSSKLCPEIEFVKKGNRMTLVRRCSRGRGCTFAHSKEEELYHPSMYKTKMCNSHPNCTRYFCPFAHHWGELRKPLGAVTNVQSPALHDQHLPTSASPFSWQRVPNTRNKQGGLSGEVSTQKSQQYPGSPTSSSTTASSSVASPSFLSSSPPNTCLSKNARLGISVYNTVPNKPTHRQCTGGNLEDSSAHREQCAATAQTNLGHSLFDTRLSDRSLQEATLELAKLQDFYYQLEPQLPCFYPSEDEPLSSSKPLQAAQLEAQPSMTGCTESSRMDSSCDGFSRAGLGSAVDFYNNKQSEEEGYRRFGDNLQFSSKDRTHGLSEYDPWKQKSVLDTTCSGASFEYFPNMFRLAASSSLPPSENTADVPFNVDDVVSCFRAVQERSGRPQHLNATETCSGSHDADEADNLFIDLFQALQMCPAYSEKIDALNSFPLTSAPNISSSLPAGPAGDTETPLCPPALSLPPANESSRFNSNTTAVNPTVDEKLYTAAVLNSLFDSAPPEQLRSDVCERKTKYSSAELEVVLAKLAYDEHIFERGDKIGTTPGTSKKGTTTSAGDDCSNPPQAFQETSSNVASCTKDLESYFRKLSYDPIMAADSFASTTTPSLFTSGTRSVAASFDQDIEPLTRLGSLSKSSLQHSRRQSMVSRQMSLSFPVNESPRTTVLPFSRGPGVRHNTWPPLDAPVQPLRNTLQPRKVPVPSPPVLSRSGESLLKSTSSPIVAACSTETTTDSFFPTTAPLCATTDPTKGVSGAPAAAAAAEQRNCSVSSRDTHCGFSVINFLRGESALTTRAPQSLFSASEIPLEIPDACTAVNHSSQVAPSSATADSASMSCSPDTWACTAHCSGALTAEWYTAGLHCLPQHLFEEEGEAKNLASDVPNALCGIQEIVFGSSPRPTDISVTPPVCSSWSGMKSQLQIPLILAAGQNQAGNNKCNQSATNKNTTAPCSPETKNNKMRSLNVSSNDNSSPSSLMSFGIQTRTDNTTQDCANKSSTSEATNNPICFTPVLDHKIYHTFAKILTHECGLYDDTDFLQPTNTELLGTAYGREALPGTEMDPCVSCEATSSRPWHNTIPPLQGISQSGVGKLQCESSTTVDDSGGFLVSSCMRKDRITSEPQDEEEKSLSSFVSTKSCESIALAPRHESPGHHLLIGSDPTEGSTYPLSRETPLEGTLGGVNAFTDGCAASSSWASPFLLRKDVHDPRANIDPSGETTPLKTDHESSYCSISGDTTLSDTLDVDDVLESSPRTTPRTNQLCASHTTVSTLLTQKPVPADSPATDPKSQHSQRLEVQQRCCSPVNGGSEGC